MRPWTATWDELVHAHGEHHARIAVARGRIVRMVRDIYAPAAFANSVTIRAEAAVKATGSRGAITGQAALFLSGLLEEPPTLVVLAIGRHHHATRVPHGVTYYRCSVRVPTWALNDLTIAEPPWALVHAMREIAPSARLGTALTVLAHRDIDAGEVAEAVDAAPYAKGRRELIKALTFHSQGIESPLELRGMRDVLTGPEFAHLERQVHVDVDGARYRLDAFDADALLAIEFDGKRYHQSPDQWEADRARDLALASAGIHTLRITHRMVVSSPEAVRARVLAVMTARRRALAA